MNRTAKAMAGAALWVLLVAAPLAATPFTPLEWQRLVDSHYNHIFVGQRKNLTWIRDQNRNFIDDEIEARFRPGDKVNVIVDLNSCLTPGQIQEIFSRFGTVTYMGKLVTFVLLDEVAYTNLPALAARPEVAMVEWQVPNQPAIDVSSRAIQAHKSNTYSPNTAEDVGLTGAGINIAIVGTGIANAPATSPPPFVTLPAFKFVAGFDASDPTDPGDGSTRPQDTLTYHETVMAVLAAGQATSNPTQTCRTPNDGSAGNCAGIAPAAGIIDVRQCSPTAGCIYGMQALDWVGINAQKFNIRIANLAFTQCVNDDGTSAPAQQVNYLAALGIVAVAAYGHSGTQGSGCPTLALGQQITQPPASASFAIAVNGTDDKGTVSRTDDTIWSNYLTGPRKDFPTTQNPLALKPDLAAPAQNLTIYESPAVNPPFIGGISGTSPSTAIVSGAAALILQKYPQMDPGSLKQLLTTYADRSHNTPSTYNPIWDTGLGWGMLNVNGALTAATLQSADVRFANCKPNSGVAPGQLCVLLDGKPSWDNEADITTAQTPAQVGIANTIYARVTNDGPSNATVQVSFGVYVFATGNNQFYHIGTVQVFINAGQTVQVPMPWTPASSNHQCVQVSIAFALDKDFTDNVTQRNLQVSPSLYHVRVENPLMVPAQFHVTTVSDHPAWRCQASPQTFPLDPFKDCAQDVTVIFNAPPGAQPGQTATCQVAVRATPAGGETRLIGGVTVRTFVPRPCRAFGQVIGVTGEPIVGAVVTFRRVRAETKPRSAVEQKPPEPFPQKVTAITDSDGVFSLRITPGVVQTVTVEKPGIGKGQITLRPSCGQGLPWLVLGPTGLQVQLSVPPTVPRASISKTSGGQEQ